MVVFVWFISQRLNLGIVICVCFVSCMCVCDLICAPFNVYVYLLCFALAFLRICVRFLMCLCMPMPVYCVLRVFVHV